jgi:hypothetical protein
MVRSQRTQFSHGCGLFRQEVAREPRSHSMRQAGLGSMKRIKVQGQTHLV